MTGAESPTMTRQGDADPALVRAAQRGDPMALGELMEILAPYVGRICGPIALQDGPDATQEALITILRGIRGLKEPAALFGWVRVIAVREAIRVARRTAWPSGMPVEEVSAASDPEGGARRRREHNPEEECQHAAQKAEYGSDHERNTPRRSSSLRGSFS